jgi:hypothetical protein
MASAMNVTTRGIASTARSDDRGEQVREGSVSLASIARTSTSRQTIECTRGRTAEPRADGCKQLLPRLPALIMMHHEHTLTHERAHACGFINTPTELQHNNNNDAVWRASAYNHCVRAGSHAPEEHLDGRTHMIVALALAVAIKEQADPL